MNRRNFFGLSAIALAPFKAVAQPLTKRSTDCPDQENVAQTIVKLVAAEALRSFIGSIAVGNLVKRDFEPVLAMAGDTVNASSLGNTQILLNRHVESTFTIGDAMSLLTVPGRVKAFVKAATIAIAEKLDSDLVNLHTSGNLASIGLAMRRLPKPIPGTGAISEYAELSGYALRVTMSYLSPSLMNLFTIDALYGATVLPAGNS